MKRTYELKFVSYGKGFDKILMVEICIHTCKIANQHLSWYIPSNWLIFHGNVGLIEWVLQYQYPLQNPERFSDLPFSASPGRFSGWKMGGPLLESMYFLLLMAEILLTS